MEKLVNFQISIFEKNVILKPRKSLIAPPNVFSLPKQEPEKKAGSEELDLFADSDEETPVKPAKPSKKKAPKQDQVCFYSLSSNSFVKFFSSAFFI